MCKKVISLVMMFMFFFSVIFGSCTVPKVFATPKTLYVSTQYPTIQAAIDDADSGDIIHVYNGTYNENLVVNKTISLIGENPSNTIIDGHGTGKDVINVNNANNVRIEGFTIQKGEGYEPASLSIWRSDGNTISNNVIRQSEYGVKVRESDSSNIINNVIVNNTNVGILLAHSSGNTIMGNLIKQNNNYGVRITSVSAPNTFYHNNIIDNTHQTFVDSPTKWDNGAEGNFWSDYAGQDLNGDGIGDAPYTITETNTDRYPLIVEWSETRNFPFYWKGVTYHTIVQSNSTVASFNFTYSLAQVSSNVTAPKNAASFCNVTIKKSFLDGTFTVFVDKVSGNYVSTSNSTHVSLYFTFIHSINATSRIQIRGTITVGNPIPIADFTYFPTYPRENQSIQFTSISSDPNGTVVAQSWDFGDGNTSIQQNPVHQYVRKETYHVTLTVTDNDGATGTTMKAILVGNRIPVANFTYSPIDPKENQEIQFNDTSTDPDGIVVAWLWNFDDGNTSSLQHPAYKYANKGSYNVTLTVTDNEGATNTITKTIVVTLFPADYTLYYVIIGIVSGAVIVAIAFFLLKQKKKNLGICCQPKGIFHAFSFILPRCNEEGESNMRYCPECGGELQYASTTKRYVCKSCGLSLTHQELIELREKLRPTFETEEEQRQKERKEYLKWWLSKKK